MHGKGTLFHHSTGTRFEGDWRKGIFIGRGTKTWVETGNFCEG